MTLIAAELRFRGAGGAALFFEALDATPVDLLGTALGAIVTVHGLGEHLGKYDEWAARARARGFHVMLYDQRGHGRSPGRRGDFLFDELVEDLSRFVEVTADRYPGAPIFLAGHSLGALLALRYAAGPVHPAVRGAAVSGTPLLLAEPPSPSFRRLVRAVHAVAPRFPFRRPRRVHTRDSARAALLAKDPLAHRRITARAMAGIAAAIEAVVADPGGVRLPLLVLFGEADALSRARESAEVLERTGSGDVTVVLVPEALHEVFQEIDRPLVYDSVLDWCAERAGP